MKLKTYSELQQLTSFEERFDYLKDVNSSIGVSTFGYDRYLNQAFYTSSEWKNARDKVILRDKGCDLGIEGREIYSNAIIHHMNPVTKKQVIERDPILFDPEFLITVSHKTHNAIHYGSDDSLVKTPVERRKNDTVPWRN